MSFACVLAALLLAACQHFRVDPSPAAWASGDKTLINGSSACAPPRQGVDMFWVQEGSKIDAVWTLIVPWNSRMVSGEMVIRYKDQRIPVPITGPKVEVKWADIVGRDTWRQDDDVPAQATATIRFKGKETEEFVDLLGIAFPVVLQRGYAPLPFGSGNESWETECKIAYTTAGRSAVKCK